MLCVVMKVPSHASPKKKTKKVKGFKFPAFMGARFSNNIMAVMGLGSTFSAQPWKGPTRYSCCLLWLKNKNKNKSLCNKFFAIFGLQRNSVLHGAGLIVFVQWLGNYVPVITHACTHACARAHTHTRARAHARTHARTHTHVCSELCTLNKWWLC